MKKVNQIFFNFTDLLFIKFEFFITLKKINSEQIKNEIDILDYK